MEEEDYFWLEELTDEDKKLYDDVLDELINDAYRCLTKQYSRGATPAQYRFVLEGYGIEESELTAKQKQKLESTKRKER